MPHPTTSRQLPLLHSQAHDPGAAWHVNPHTGVRTEGRVVADSDSDSVVLFEYREPDGTLRKQWVSEGHIDWVHERSNR
jgi:hypothetical protein